MITKEQRELNLKWIRKIRHERANKPTPQWLLDYELAVEMEDPDWQPDPDFHFDDRVNWHPSQG